MADLCKRISINHLTNNNNKKKICFSSVGHRNIQELREGGHDALAEHLAESQLSGLGHHRRGKQRHQEEEQDKYPASLVHRGQDPQRLLQQAERQVGKLLHFEQAGLDKKGQKTRNGNMSTSLTAHCPPALPCFIKMTV